jgi:Gamma-glutamyl cyclotransferase, AIG2-like
MDNAVAIPGYKVYVDSAGTRPDVCVAFLDVREQSGAWVNGECVPVDAVTLAALDARERNYVRVDVSGQVEPDLGPTWVYAGRPDSRERYRAAVATGRCVVARPYAELVEAGFRELGGWGDFLASTDDHRPALADLTRVDLDP